ncbi:MAG: glycosyltransferase family 4 protein [Candidatus Sericytochromatia bacterium]
MPKPIKLLWIHDRARGTGGAERYLTQVAPALKAHGFQSSLLYGPGHSQPDFLNAFDTAWPAVDLSKQIRQLQPDLIYLHRQPGARDNWSSELESLLSSGIPVLRFYHDHQLFCLREHKYTGFGKETCSRNLGTHCYLCPGMLVREAEGLALRTLGPLKAQLGLNQKLERAVVASDYFANHLEAHGFDRARITTAPLFAEPESPRLPCPAQNPWQFLFVGQLVTGKGLDLLLEALVAVPQAQLVIAGEGRQSALYRAQAAKLGLSGRVQFVGQLSAGELAHWQDKAAAVVIPSRAPETFALTGVEAMASGRAVISSDVGGVRTWLKPGINGLLFPSGNIPALAYALRRLGQNPDLSARMGQHGYDLWKAQFRLNHHLQLLVPVLKQMSVQQSRLQEAI